MSAIVVEGAEAMLALVGDLEQVHRHAALVRDSEKRADDITHQTIELLHHTFLTPFDRFEFQADEMLRSTLADLFRNEMDLHKVLRRPVGRGVADRVGVDLDNSGECDGGGGCLDSAVAGGVGGG